MERDSFMYSTMYLLFAESPGSDRWMVEMSIMTTFYNTLQAIESLLSSSNKWLLYQHILNYTIITHQDPSMPCNITSSRSCNTNVFKVLLSMSCDFAKLKMRFFKFTYYCAHLFTFSFIYTNAIQTNTINVPLQSSYILLAKLSTIQYLFWYYSRFSHIFLVTISMSLEIRNAFVTEAMQFIFILILSTCKLYH